MKKKILVLVILFSSLTIVSYAQHPELGIQAGVANIQQQTFLSDLPISHTLWPVGLYLQMPFGNWRVAVNGQYYNETGILGTPYNNNQTGNGEDTGYNDQYHRKYLQLGAMVQYKLYESDNKKWKGYMGVTMSGIFYDYSDTRSIYVTNGTSTQNIYGGYSIAQTSSSFLAGPNLSVSYQLQQHININGLIQIQFSGDANFQQKEDYLLGLGYTFFKKEHHTPKYFYRVPAQKDTF